MPYEKLLHEAYQLGIDVYEQPMLPKNKGLYSDNVIWINKFLHSSIEKGCVLAEELGHHHTSCGDILDQSKLINRKQEKRARNWAYKRLIPLTSFIDAHKDGVKNRYELAFYLGVTEPFIEETLERYKEEFGVFTIVDEYTVYFEPLGILEKI